MLTPHSTAYGWLMLAGIFTCILFWSRVARRDDRLVLIYIAALAGALLGGYAAVEIAKHLLGYPGVTGDWFALITPVTILLGRLGCVLHGGCLGRVCEASWFTMNDANGLARWPAAAVELLFNALLLGVLALRHRRKFLPGQRFHVYLIADGLFRFAHEFLRDTPRILGPLSGYQIAALAVAGLGGLGFISRRRKLAVRQQN